MPHSSLRYSRTGVGKLASIGQIWSTACFCMAHQLGLGLTFLKRLKKNQKNNISKHMKFM